MLPRRFAGFAIAAGAGVLTIAAAADRPGYLNETVDIVGVVPPAPKKGDPRYEADRRVFRLTRSLLNTPRGRFATSDVPYSMPDLMRDFSCAAGVTLSPEKTPATYRLLINVDSDTARANEAAKQTWKRLRPFQIDRGPICQSKDELAKSYDYPSGHTTHGWTFGLVLSELLPARANEALIRARAYGESRVVCGAHNMSAIEAGRLGATVTFQHVRLSDGYRTDLEAARRELMEAQKSGASVPDSPSCKAERQLTAPSIFASVGGR